MCEPVFRSGFACLIGLPNAGKSTLLNQLAGMRLAITSPKPQTTRQVIRAIIDEPDSQIIFLDTPGLHEPGTRMGTAMVNSTMAAIADSDLVVLITDAQVAARSSDRLPRQESQILERLRTMGKPVILVLNKADAMPKEQLLPVIARYAGQFSFHAIIPISARTGDGLSELLASIRALLPPGPQYYPAESLTDQTERSLAAELIREQILLQTHDEIPHGAAVAIESFEETGSPVREQVRLAAVIYCDKDSHKGILIGRQGSMLKKIGTAARLEIEAMLGCPCYLELFVKVREGWRDRCDILRDLGLEIRP